MTDKAWKAAERAVARKLGTRRTPLSGRNSGHTGSDTLHEDLYVEVKLRRRPPLWDELDALRARARRARRAPLLVVDQADGSERLAVTRLDDLVSEGVPDRLAGPAVFDRFLVEHVVLRRSALFALWTEVEAAAAREGKRALVVYKAGGRPGELAAWSPVGIARPSRKSAADGGPGPSKGEGPCPPRKVTS